MIRAILISAIIALSQSAYADEKPDPRIARLDELCARHGMIGDWDGVRRSGGRGAQRWSYWTPACRTEDGLKILVDIDVLGPPPTREYYRREIPKEICGDYKGPYGYEGICK